MEIIKNRIIKKIFVHCSDSPFGNVLTIDKWHRDRKFDCVGYNAIILNGFTEPHTPYNILYDGQLCPGRHEDAVPAQCRGHNMTGYGYCLISKSGIVSPQQLITSKALSWSLLHRHGLSVDDIVGHCEYDDKKTCPGFDMDLYRAFMRDGILIKELSQKWHDERNGG